MRAKAEEVKKNCEKLGFGLLIYCTFRSPQEQALLFRRGRSLVQISAKMDELSGAGFPTLAKILAENKNPPGQGLRIVTQAGPGQSWHQYGEAWDAVPLVGGKPMWLDDDPVWQRYGQAVRKAGLYWAGDWKTFKEFPHAQLRDSALGSPLKVLGMEALVRLEKAQDGSLFASSADPSPPRI